MSNTDAGPRSSPPEVNLHACTQVDAVRLQLPETLLVNSGPALHYHSAPSFTPQWLLCRREPLTRVCHVLLPNILCVRRFAAAKATQRRGGNVTAEQNSGRCPHQHMRVSPGKLSFCLAGSLTATVLCALGFMPALMLMEMAVATVSSAHPI